MQSPCIGSPGRGEDALVSQRAVGFLSGQHLFLTTYSRVLDPASLNGKGCGFCCLLHFERPGRGDGGGRLVGPKAVANVREMLMCELGFMAELDVVLNLWRVGRKGDGEEG